VYLGFTMRKHGWARRGSFEVLGAGRQGEAEAPCVGHRSTCVLTESGRRNDELQELCLAA
jgi:hypothetical protein